MQSCSCVQGDRASNGNVLSRRKGTRSSEAQQEKTGDVGRPSHLLGRELAAGSKSWEAFRSRRFFGWFDGGFLRSGSLEMMVHMSQLSLFKYGATRSSCSFESRLRKQLCYLRSVQGLNLRRVRTNFLRKAASHLRCRPIPLWILLSRTLDQSCKESSKDRRSAPMIETLLHAAGAVRNQSDLRRAPDCT